MNLKHLRWVIVVVAVVIVASMMGAMAWASSPADDGSEIVPIATPADPGPEIPPIATPADTASEIVPLATPGLDADKVDGADAVDSWAPAIQRAGNVVKTMSNGRINPASFPLGYFDGRYLNASNINTGTLNVARYSAYSDLSSEGRIDCSASGDLCTRSSNDARYVNEGTKYMSIHGVAFKPQEDQYDHGATDAYLYQNYNDAYFYRAPVSLPHGATVTGLYAYYEDTDPNADEDVVVWINRVNHTGSWNYMAACNSMGAPGWSSCWDTSVTNPVIDNWNYTYQVTVRLTCDNAGVLRHKLSAVVIRYTDS